MPPAVFTLAALAARLVYAWYYQRTHTAQGLSTIPFLLEPGNIAAALASGYGFSNPLRIPTGPTAWMTPVYPLMLAAIFRVFGLYTLRAYEAAALLNILLSALTCVPIYLTGKRISSARLAMAAAGLWAVFPNALIIASETMWDASLSAFLVAWIVWATLRVTGSQRIAAWCAYGLIWGIAIMTNATLVLALPILLAWLLFRERRYLPLAGAAVAMLCCIPWTVRNYDVLHAWIPLRSVAGVSLWMGTMDPALGRWPGSYHPLADATERRKFSEMGEVAYMRDKQRVALQFMREHPSTELRLCAERFLGLWAGGDLKPFHDFRNSHSLWFRWIVAFNLITFAAGAGGAAILIWNSSRFALPLLAFPVVVTAPYYLSLVSARYRLPVDPAVMILAAIGFQKLWVRFRAGSSEFRPPHYRA